MISPRNPLPTLVAAVLLAALPSIARADEIVHKDPETCELITDQAEEIVAETWTEVVYRDRARGPEKVVPAALVVEVRRDAGDSKQVRGLLGAIRTLERGDLAEARETLRVLSGGGFDQNLEDGSLIYKDFTANDPPGRNKRPPWTSEYAHFNYAKALYLEGLARGDKDLLKQAYYALVDQKAPEGDGKTGGFLGRFDGGNSRFYPEAMHLAAMSLLKQGNYEKAAKAFQDLEEKSIALDIGPRWAFEAKIGQARIAEAQGKHLDAINAATDTANFMKLLLQKEERPCVRRELGRLFSEARMYAADVMLQQAEANRSPAEFRRLRTFIEEGMPEALRVSLSTLPESQRLPLVEGAMSPRVQAVAQLGLGLALLQEKKYEEALYAFRAVEVKYFEEPTVHAKALRYLAQASDAAAKQSSGAARALYEKYRDDAEARLKKEYPNQ